MENFIGKMLDNRYEILEVIGSGGMAVVYKALCHRLNRFVAVKVLKGDLASDADFRRRFHAESQAVAMLSHPNIVAVYDVSRSSEVEYIVMELIDGITLKQYMQKKGTLTWREALHFSTQIVKALSHAHNRGIIHRDIKPHNIMILRDGSVKVADFGIARLASAQNTLTQEALGSVHYISPEQARGSHIDGRSDLYSVGVVMYEMLTGRLPYEGESPVSVAIQHINSIPLWPREINPELPEALEAITMKAMSANLSKRYTSAEVMLHDLEEFRKNPSINFDYEPKDLVPQEENSEPTRALPAEARTAAPRRAVAPVPPPPPADDEDEDEEDYARGRKNRMMTTLTGVAAVLVFVAGMLFLILQLASNPNSGPTEEVTVPRLTGYQYEEMVAAYGDILDIQALPEGKHSNLYEAGVILEQDPAPQSKAKKGATVKVTLSLGAHVFTMPNYYNLDYRQVQTELVRIKLNVKEVIYETSDLVVDQVIRTDPPVNTEMREGDWVTLYVSAGPRIEKVAMPDLVGQKMEDVPRILETYKLLEGNTVWVASDKPMGQVVWQSVAPKEEIEQRTKIDIQVSLGPPSPPPSPSPSPTPSPTPTPTHTLDPNQQITVPLMIKHTATTGMIQVKVMLNDVVLYNEVDNAVNEYFHGVATGYPGDVLTVFFDDVLTYTVSLGSLVR